MFFENESLSFNILDVIALKQEQIHMFNKKRKFCALSFRFCADATLKTAAQTLHAGDHTLCFIPEGLDYARSGPKDELIAVHFNAINCPTDGIELFHPKNPETIAGLFRKMQDCWNRREPGFKYQCSALLYEILAECCRQTRRTPSSNPKIRKSVEYLLAHYKDPALTIRAAAEQSYISEVYFRRLFKAEFGLSPQKYVIHLRIQYAVSLITAGYYSLKEVAFLSGYNDYKYFSAEFRRIKGVAPSEYVYAGKDVRPEAAAPRQNLLPTAQPDGVG